jgi:hypothetical protein
MSREIAETCFDENIRVEKIIWLAAQADQYPRDVQEFFEDASAEEQSELLDIKISKELADTLWHGDDDNIGEIFSRLGCKGRLGFLVKAATPIPFDFREGGGYSHCGFGRYRTKWFYTDALDPDFIKKLVAWKEEVVERERKKAESGK